MGVQAERIGKESGWVPDGDVKPPIPPVSLFTAGKPPSIALIAGREGGMLRVVLCHYGRSTATLYKETVLRMETPIMNKAG